ncbi:MAG TPA: hypothetical protein VLA19_04690 [Herpetosiphonaceae bacterium]|nr:hypothetical protein [Herpetosiphonaceae bacterium]
MITPTKIWEAEQALQAWQAGRHVHHEYMGRAGQGNVRAILVRCRGIYRRLMLRAAGRTAQPQASFARIVR